MEGGERRQFEKRTAQIEQRVDSITREEFSSGHVSLTRGLGTARRVIEATSELFDEGALRRRVARKGFAMTIDHAGESLHWIPQFELVMIN